MLGPEHLPLPLSDEHQVSMQQIYDDVLCGFPQLRSTLEMSSPSPYVGAVWFDMSRRISKDDRKLCEAQIALYAHKDGMDPEGPEWRAAVAHLRKA
jgi:hypothetical protein